MEKRDPLSGRTLPELLNAYAASGDARFHMPGHKGRGMHGFFRPETEGWDVTELSFTDNLHQPETGIARIQDALASAYGAKHAFLSVGGSTAALHAMILSLHPKRDRLLLARDCHKSCVTGAALSGVPVDFVTPAYDEKTGLPGMVSAEALDAALDATHATAVLLTSPNCYGLCADLPALSKIAHAHSALLLVDAAHGAHFPFSDALPAGPKGYADLWCHSQHKTMNALTQAASLFLGDCRIAPETVQRALAMVETTSPSYLLMLSVDWAVYTARRQDWTALARRARTLGRRISAMPGLSVLPDAAPALFAPARDVTRLVVDVSERGVTGYQAAAALESAGVYVEMADYDRIVCITSPEDDPAWYETLLSALQKLPYGKERCARPGCRVRIPEKRMALRDAAMSPMRQVPLAEAAGLIAGEAVGAYPPGIAACMPGEVLDAACVAMLLAEQAAGAAVFGLRNGNVSVVDEA